jgi:hypothetical protein
MSTALALYLWAVIQDGDYLNDWATHLPFWAVDAALLGGQALAFALGH